MIKGADGVDRYFVGNFKKGKKNGHGELYEKNGKIIFEGQFHKDKPEGIFKFFRDKKYTTFDIKNLEISNLKNIKE